MEISGNISFVDCPDASKGIHNYPPNRAPLLESPLLKLPLGSIKAGGWLRKQLDLMCSGMTGHLKELSHFLAEDNGWLGGSADAWEEQPYWLRGFYNLGILTGDERIRLEAERWIKAVIESRQDDGYFGPTCDKDSTWFDDRTVADLWPHMVMLDLLRSYYEFSGDESIISLMIDFFHWCETIPDEKFMPPFKNIDESFYDRSIPENIRGYIQTQRAGDMLPHIYWLYNHTGSAWLLTLASRFIDKLSPPAGEWLDRHVVNFTQRFRFSGNYYMQSKDPADIAETENWYSQHMSVWGQMPGGVFAGDELIRAGKTDPRQAFETCAMVEFNKSFYILGGTTGQAVYADRAETMTFNLFPVSMTPDLKALHYLTAVNQPQLDSSKNHDYYNRNGRMVDYQPGEHYRCCQHNVAMGWPYFTEHLWLAAAGDGIAAWMYAESEVHARVGDGVGITIVEKTDYPFDTHINLSLYPEKNVEFPLYLRIPGWCKNMTVKLNGYLIEVQAKPGKYLVLDLEWQPGDTVELFFPQEISITRWEKSAGSVTVNRGPLSYSLKIDEEWKSCGGTAQWPEWEVFPKTPWNFGIMLEEANPEKSISVKKVDKPAEQPWSVENAPVELSAKGKRIPGWKLTNETVDPLPQSPVKSGESIQEITLVPMGCARLRIGCFPVIGEETDTF